MSEEVVKMLKERGETVSVAESCTGGRLAAAFTSEPGASEYFKGGVVAYANEVKKDVLGVRPETLEKHGAVSPDTAREMALGARRIIGTDWAIATTGIAGPGGATDGKPVGTAFVAVAGSGGVWSRGIGHDGSRAENMEYTAEQAVGLLREVMDNRGIE